MDHKDVVLKNHIIEKMIASIEVIADADRPKTETDLRLMQGVFYKRLEKDVEDPNAPKKIKVQLTSRKKKAKEFLSNLVAAGMLNNLDNVSNTSIGNIPLNKPINDNIPTKESAHTNRSRAINIYGGENKINTTKVYYQDNK